MFLCWISGILYSCENIRTDLMFYENKKIQLRYFITINYSSISNEIIYRESFYLKSLYEEINSFDKNISKARVIQLFYQNKDPFDFAMSVTKELS